MTDTLLREFEEWLHKEYEKRSGRAYVDAIVSAQEKLEELKKKYKIE